MTNLTFSMRASRVAAAAFVVASFCLAGCWVNTRAAIQNAGDEPVDVTLSSGDEVVEYGSVAPNTTSEFEKVDFDDYSSVTLESNGKKQSIELEPETDNTVTIQPDGSPETKSTYNEDNEFW